MSHRTPRGTARGSGSAPGGSGAAAMLAARRPTGQAAPFGHARAILELQPAIAALPTATPAALPAPAAPAGSRSVLTVPDAFMALHRRRSQERKGMGNVRRRLTSSPRPAPGDPRGDWLRAERDWSTQLSVSARGPGFRAGGAAWPGPARAPPIVGCR